MDGDAPTRPRNKLLAALPAADYRRVRASLQLVDVEQRTLAFAPNQPFPHVYFPEAAVFSIVARMQDGIAIEVATVGFEGMMGLPAYLGTLSTPNEGFCQISGRALRLDIAAFQREMDKSGRLRQLLDAYIQAFINQIAQSAACNQAHNVTQRCARWLLQTHDRAGRDEFPLTHEFLAQMLGVRRATVSEVAAEFQSRGLISYSRGQMTMRDRPGLESVSCECYAVISREYQRLIG